MKSRAATITWDGDKEHCSTVFFYKDTSVNDPGGIIEHTYQSINTALYAAGCYLKGVGILDDDAAEASRAEEEYRDHRFSE